MGCVSAVQRRCENNEPQIVERGLENATRKRVRDGWEGYYRRIRTSSFERTNSWQRERERERKRERGRGRREREGPLLRGGHSADRTDRASGVKMEISSLDTFNNQVPSRVYYNMASSVMSYLNTSFKARVTAPAPAQK